LGWGFYIDGKRLVLSDRNQSIKDTITQKLASALDLQHLEVVNESDKHNVPAGSESHFKVVLVSDSFKGVTLVAQHKQVHSILSHELANDIHALAIHTFTEEKWRKKNGEIPLSPPCLGGSR
jgi:BolA protein